MVVELILVVKDVATFGGIISDYTDPGSGNMANVTY